MEEEEEQSEGEEVTGDEEEVANNGVDIGEAAGAEADGGKKNDWKKGKTASALIHHIPPEKRSSKKNGVKEEQGSRGATPIQQVDGEPPKEKTKAKPVVIRVCAEQVTF